MNLLIQPDLWNDLKEMDRDAYQQANYIKRYSLCPIYKSESCSYLTPGEAVMPIMVEELKKAKEFIFIEYFTIGKSLFWNTLLQELIEKAKQGVEIRIIYDAYGSRKTLPRNYDKCLEAMGLKCRVFHPLTPLHLLRANYRDHRKMLIIDGTIVFTGGMNLDDEYINVNQKYGYWKDSVLKLNGAPVWNFTVMFLSTWNYISKSKEDILHYKKEVLNDNSLKAVGFIQPFADTPLDNERISETVYLNLIQKANDYLYLSTPYLILDQVMMNALCTAAKNGIDVRIITPHIPDKQLVHLLTRSFYDELLKAGIKIYEFTPGFIHIKSLVADDKIAILGTVNMDYRSFNQDLECGLWIYGDPCISHIKQDFLSIMDVSEVISESQSKKEAWVTRLANSILQIFAPLF